MLTETEIEELRESVRRAASSKEGTGTWFRYADGPLQGLLVRIPEGETDYVHGWCAHSQVGAIVAFYRCDPEKRVCAFERYSPPCSEPASWGRWGASASSSEGKTKDDE
jgi:hypothetical protein